MRVAVTLFDDRFAGPSKRVVEVAPELQVTEEAARDAIETILILPEGKGNAEDLAVQAGLQVRRVDFARVPRPRQVFRLLAWLVCLPRDVGRFRKVFKAEAVSLVHNSGAFFLAPALAAKVSRLPLLWHLNDTIVPRGVAPWLGRLVRWMSDAVIVEGHAVGRHYGVPDDVAEIVFAPVRVETYQRTRSSARKVLEGPSVCIGLIANWTPIKGVHFFVEALVALYKDLGSRLRVVFAGARWHNHAEYCRQVDARIDASGLRAVVVDYGFVQDIETVLRELDILVLSSTTEACPMVVLEAMAAGVPVVATNVGSVQELVRRPDRPAGVVVPAGNAYALEKGLREILEDPDRARALGENGRRVARELFSVAVAAHRHRELYERLAR